MGSVRTNLLRKENPSQGGDSTFTARLADSFPLLVLAGAAGAEEGAPGAQEDPPVPINGTLTLC